MKTYDLVVIGAGSGGLTAAFTGVGFGKKVLLIDKNKPGGECTWSGCVPSKALINEAKKVYQVKQYVPTYEVDTKVAMDHVKAVREGIYTHEDPDTLKKAGIDFLLGRAKFIDRTTIEVDQVKITAKKIIISTGSSPLVPPITGLGDVPYLTNESLFELERLPKSIIILGGGAIGVEMAQSMNRLGVDVQLVEMMPNLMFKEELNLVQALERQLAKEGVVLNLGAKAVQVAEKDGQIVVSLERDGKITEIFGEGLLVAIGRKPNIENLGLEEAGIDYDRKGIKVNDGMKTSVHNIWAIGDVVGPYLFSHMANVQGIMATQNAIFPIQRKVSYKNVAWVTFTEPELARAGMTEAEAREVYGDKIRVYDYDFNDLDRARTKGATIECMKLILDAKGKVLGASILADRAGEMIGEIQVLKTLGHNFSKMGNVIHPYPTYSEVFSKIGKKVMVDNLLNLPIVKVFRK